MSNLADKLKHVESLLRTIQSKGAIPDELERKINYKFRLECNYNSNKIEGGTLTKPETRSVMIGNITVDGKPLKDIREMQGHDEVMKEILHIGKGEKRIAEKRIRDIHRKIIVPEAPEQEMETGKWKQTGNHIYNYKGEKFEFTPPDEVPAAIHELLNWLNAGLDKIHTRKKDAPDPLLLAFEFHTQYLTIHPFADGNGRTARVLTNLILVSLGYPPFWVTEGGEKDSYNRYLADVQAYGGSPDQLYSFLAGLVARSLQLKLDAYEGKAIEDLDDWKKELTLLKNSMPEDAITTLRSDESMALVLENSIQPTIEKLLRDLTAFDDLFLEKQLWLGSGNWSGTFNTSEEMGKLLKSVPPNENMHFNYFLGGFKKSKEAPFSISCKLIWTFEPYEYFLTIEKNGPDSQFKRQYNQYYKPHEIDEIARQCGQSMLGQLKEHTEI